MQDSQYLQLLNRIFRRRGAYRLGRIVAKSFPTRNAALVPSSMAPSIKLRHPRAQSEFAK